MSLITKKPLSSLPKPKVACDSIDQQYEVEKAGIQFNEDPIAYFSKHKDGTGHRFLYLVRAKEPTEPGFSPYDLVCVPQRDIKPCFFTMSANGITCRDETGAAEQMPIPAWIREQEAYATRKH